MENAARQARLKGSSVRYGDTVQLQHMLTGKYIGVSTTHTSVLERSKLMVGKKVLITNANSILKRNIINVLIFYSWNLNEQKKLGINRKN